MQTPGLDEKQRERWRNLGRKLETVGAATIGGYLKGGLIGAGVEILGGFLRKRRGIEIPDQIDQIDQIDVGAIEAEVESLSAEDLKALRIEDAQVKIEALKADQAVFAGAVAAHASDNATDDKFVKRTRPGLAWKWSTIGAILVLAPLFGWVDDENKFVFQLSLVFTAGILGGIILFFFGSRGMEKIAAILGNRFGSSPADKLRDILTGGGR